MTGKVVQERSCFKYGLEYKVTHYADSSLPDDDPAKYSIDVKISVFLDSRDWSEGYEVPYNLPENSGVTDKGEVVLANLSMGVESLTAEEEETVIEEAEKEVGSLFRKLLNWKRKGRL